MKLSIYIVSHNYKEYIKQCLDSVIRSTEEFRSQLQLAIIDDCSDDGSKEIIHEYRNCFDLIVLNDKNLGLIKSCNKIINQLTGDYVVRVDADDYVEDNFISEFLQVVSLENYDLIYPNYFLVDQSGKTIALYERNIKSNIPSFNRPFHGAFTFIKRKFLNEIGGYNESFSRQDGYFLWLQGILNKAKVFHHPVPMFCYRQHRGSLSSNKRKLFDTRYNINEYYLKSNYYLRKVTVLIPIETDALIEKRMEIIRDIDFTDFHVICLVNGIALNKYEKELVSLGFDLYNRETSASLTYIDDIASCVEYYDLDDFVIFEPEYPFINPKAIMDTVLTSLFFDFDICNSVLLETSTCFVQDELSFKRFNHSTKTRSERNEVFRLAGGIKYFRNKLAFSEYVIRGREDISVGHVEIDSLSAIRLIDVENLIKIYNEKKINC